MSDNKTKKDGKMILLKKKGILGRHRIGLRVSDEQKTYWDSQYDREKHGEPSDLLRAILEALMRKKILIEDLLLKVGLAEIESEDINIPNPDSLNEVPPNAE